MKYKTKRILIVNGPDNSGGPMTWKNGLVAELRKNNIEVLELKNRLTDIIKNVRSIIQTSVIHAYSLTINSFVLIVISFLLKKKIVFTLHGNYFNEEKSKSGIKKILFVPGYNLMVKMSGVITFPSSFLKQEIFSRINLNKKNYVIPNGISLNKKNNKSKFDLNYWTSKKKYNFLEITGFNYLEKANGLIPLVEAVNKYNLKHSKKIVLNILGDGKYFEKFINLKSRYIKFLGHQNPTPYLESCDICIHSTFLDNMPYSLIEAMSYHKSIIATHTGGIPEMIDTRCLCQPEVESLYKKITLYLNNPKYVLKSIQVNKVLLQKFKWSNVVNEFRDVYEGL